jgi:hypothetical protein
VILLGFLALIVAWPEAGTLTVIFVVYTNIAVVAKTIHGVPHLVASSFSLLLFVPLVGYLVFKREKLIIDQPFILLLFFLAALLASSLFAKDLKLAIDWIMNFFLEGVLLYLLIINVVRRVATLRRVTWVLMLAGSLLGALTLYQEVTQSYDQTFGGLAQRDLEHIGEEDALFGPRTDIKEAHRAAGPIGEPNRYAQLMIVLLPLALFQFWAERSWWLRASAVAANVLLLSGILLSYSRGAFVTLMLLLLLMTCMRYIRPRQILISLAGLTLLIAAAAPGYFARMDTIRGVEGLFSQEASQTPDAVTRGRTTEMLAAWSVFVDYPILGVGPGQYTPFYSKDYQVNLPRAFRYIPIDRRAHSLYPELAAETGIVGLAVFMAIALLSMYRLWQARHRWIQSRPDLANTATAFLLSIIAYLGTSVFLSFAYQRFYWLLLALAGAAVQIFHSEIPHRDWQKEVPLKKPSVLNQTTL